MNCSTASCGTSPTFDVSQIQSHVELLHQLADGVDGKFVVFVQNGDQPGVTTHHKPGDVSAMVAAVEAHAATVGANVYCGLHLMRPDLPRGKRGGKADIVAVLGLVADLDADTGKAGEMPVGPSYVVETSTGNKQSVVLFDSPVSPDVAVPLAVALRAASGGDSGTADIAHVWRIPGTLNWPGETKLKRGRSPDPVAVRCVEPFVGVVYAKGYLESVLAPYAKPATSAAEHMHFSGHVDTTPLAARSAIQRVPNSKTMGNPTALPMRRA
jgi:hypothetical protein